MRITSHIFQVGGSGLSGSGDAAVYLVKTDTECALIDAGTGDSTGRIMKNIGKNGCAPDSVSHLFLTHCHYDHTGGVNEIRRRTGCAVVAHEAAAEYLEAGDSRVTAASWYGTWMEPTAVDIHISESERQFPVGGLTLNFYHAPGHSPGSSVYTVTSDGMLVLFGQDVHGPLNDTLLSERGRYRESLEFLLSLEADILCEGHFGVYSGRDKVRSFIESFL